VLVRGARLPALPGGERFWGETVLIPLGFAARPDLAEPLLREGLGLGEEELALLTPAGVEVIPHAVFRPLTRAGVRLALREQT
jgi:hypothetical protein